MPAGTTIPAVKQAAIDKISARLGATANVQYTRPTDASDRQADNGASAMVYIDAQIDGTFDVNVMTGGALWIDETYTLPIVIQVQSANGETQEECDELAAELAHGVLGAFAQKPTLELSDGTELKYFSMLPRGLSYLSDAVGDSPNIFGTRFIVNVEVNARLELT